MEPVKVGIVGCGNISAAYLKTLRTFDCVKVAACADLMADRANEKAREFGIPTAYSTEELLADPEIEIVLNLTVPTAHYAVAKAALLAGKCVQNEKPLTTTREDAQELLALAKEKNLLLGCAPDTVMGGGIQTSRKLIDDGWIGEPVAAFVTMMYPGPETFHPDPTFFYQPGAGPMFDMGPYYLTALTVLVGPIQRVTCSAKATYPERTIVSEPLRGQKIAVNTPTHIVGLMEFNQGMTGTITTSFDVWEPYNPQMVLYGTQGTLQVPDANTFYGPVRYRPAGASEFKEIPIAHSYGQPGANHRGIGVADMAIALRTGRAHRTNGNIAYHVLDVMHSFLESAESGKRLAITSTCKRPAPVPIGLREGTLD